MYTVTRDAKVRQVYPFGCVGSGGPIALAALRQRKFTSIMEVREAMYYVWEAKTLSEIAPGVGKDTTMVVLTPGKDSHSSRLYSVNVGGKASLQDKYMHCGLQPFSHFAEPFAEFLYPSELLNECNNVGNAPQSSSDSGSHGRSDS